MKTIHQIAKECGLSYVQVYNLVISNMIVGTLIKRRRYFNKHQEDLIHYLLYIRGFVNEIVLESKINNENDDF